MTIANGVRLVSLKADGTVAATAAAATLDADQTTIHWHFGAGEWATFTNGEPQIQVSITSTLRTYSWGDTPFSSVPEFARKLYTAKSDANLPLILTSSLSSLASLSGAGNEEPLYEIKSLYMAGETYSKTKLLTGFHAFPYNEPANGLIFARARWYDPSTGTFLTPDPMGYHDASSLYAFAGGDPVNYRDPDGREQRISKQYAQNLGQVGPDLDKLGSDLKEVFTDGWHVLQRQLLAMDRLGRDQKIDDEGQPSNRLTEWKPETFVRNLAAGTITEAAKSLWTFAKYTNRQKGRDFGEKLINGGIKAGEKGVTNFLKKDEHQQREAIVTLTVVVMEQIAASRAMKTFTEAPLACGVIRAEGSLEGAMALQERAAQLNTARNSWMAKNGTTAVARVQNVVTGEVRTWVATESEAIPAEWEDALADNEDFIEGSGHAEDTIVNALGNEWRLVEGGTSRNVCTGICEPALTGQGAEIGGPKFRGRADKTRYRMFWVTSGGGVGQ